MSPGNRAVDQLIRSIDKDLNPPHKMSREEAIGLLLEGLVGLEVMLPLVRQGAQKMLSESWFQRLLFWLEWGAPYKKVQEVEEIYEEFTGLLETVRSSNAKVVNVEARIVEAAHEWFSMSREFKQSKGYR